MMSGLGAGLDAIGGEVVVVGSLNADLTVRTERFPKAGETVTGREFAVLPGGKSANQAVQAARLGARVQMIGAVGRDAHGEMLRRSLHEAGVETGGLAVSEQPTGTALITVEDSGANTIVVSPGANSDVDDAMVKRHRDLIAGASVLGLCMEIDAAAVETAAVQAQELGTTVVFNNSPFHAELPAGLMRNVDVLVLNEHELRELLVTMTAEDCELLGELTDPRDDDWSRCAALLAQLGLRAVVVTLGGAGAVVVEDQQVTPIAPYSVEVVDTTGAGDSFFGTLLAGLASEMSLVESAQLASAVAAYATRSLGAQASYGDREAIREYWEQ